MMIGHDDDDDGDEEQSSFAIMKEFDFSNAYGFSKCMSLRGEASANRTTGNRRWSHAYSCGSCIKAHNLQRSMGPTVS